MDIAQKRQTILNLMSAVPIVSTDQILRYFTEFSRPRHRCSEFMCELVAKGLIESRGRDAFAGESKIWRLTKQGRDLLDVRWHPIDLRSRNVNHILEIGDTYMWLRRYGSDDFKYWTVELREFMYKNAKGDDVNYCPDAFFGWRGRAFLLEVQTSRSPLTEKRWKAKWARAEEFFKDSPGYYKTASWQKYRKSDKSPYISPTIVVVTNQTDETVRAGTLLPLIIVKHISELEVYV